MKHDMDCPVPPEARCEIEGLPCVDHYLCCTPWRRWAKTNSKHYFYQVIFWGGGK